MILTIHDEFPSSTLSQGMTEESCMPMIDTFNPFTETDIRQLLKRSSNVFCAIDPMPIWLVKEYGCSDKPDYKYSSGCFLKIHQICPCKIIEKSQFGLQYSK